MSRWHIDRHVEREEARLGDDLASGMISDAEYYYEIRLLHEEARDAAREEYEREMDDLAAEWGYFS